MSSPNLYRALRDALGLDVPVQVGTVVSVSQGVAVVELPGGDRITARGDAPAAGSMVFVRGGVIEGSAPGMSYVEIDI